MTIDTDPAQIAAYLRENMSHAQDTARIGPFVARFDANSDNRYRNYALPDDDAVPTSDEVQALIQAFKERGRIPRLEYVPESSPAVLPELTLAGFEAEGRLPLMVCSRFSLRTPMPPEGVQLVLATSDADLEASASVQNEAYGEPTTSPADVRRLQRTIEQGGAVALARATADGEAIGSGLYSAPWNGTTEIAALGVRAAFRRRGVGASLTALLTSDALARGNSRPFLMAASEVEGRLYARLGFGACATMLHISLSTAHSSNRRSG